ncbi:unnamed protein product [Heligmosomoides polygyrus]|uniref:Secreted protein n=1 Tax=Heligmosomoides polygyrus TaxID=6339 RepID=A0A183F6K8_HELPZ|nr:unnamed protein product [Heligmosomoides polygyrus]
MRTSIGALLITPQLLLQRLIFLCDGASEPIDLDNMRRNSTSIYEKKNFKNKFVQHRHLRYEIVYASIKNFKKIKKNDDYDSVYPSRTSDKGVMRLSTLLMSQ